VGVVTRPAGTTPRGLPYPGSAGIHANTPAALQALAEAVTGQLTSLGNGVILETFTGVVTIDSYDRGYGIASFRIPWVKLRVVLGSVVSYGSFAGGPGSPGWIQAPDATHGSPDYMIIHANHNVAPYGYTFKGQNVSMCAFGWGTA
jgi:hypothetical protein